MRAARAYVAGSFSMSHIAFGSSHSAASEPPDQARIGCWSANSAVRRAWSEARESIQRMAGRSGRPSASSTATVEAVVADAIATTGPAARQASVAISSCVASTIARHHSAGSCSAQPERGKVVR